jgi:4-amino-4-deoxy-L-arabinose transferase-like glycosyltransferase
MKIKHRFLSSREFIATTFFYLFCTVHLLVWTFVPFFFRGNVPFDTIEGIAWGFQWQLGYDKHPPFAAWLCALATKIFHITGLPVYFLAQISTVVAFWAVWRLSKRFLPPLHALISVVLLEGIIYYNLLTPKFNPTTLMTPLWALATFIFYLALTQKKCHQWLLFGVVCVLAMLAKLQSFILFLTFLSILIFTREGRNSFKHYGLYLAIFIGILLFIPHIVWQYHHNFLEIIYAVKRTEAHMAHTLLSRLNHPINLLISEIGAVCGLFILLLPFAKGKHIFLSLSRFQWQFLILINTVPLGFTLLYSLVFNSHIHSTWCTPYFFALGILSMVILRPYLTRKNIKSFLILWSIIFILVPLGRFGYLFANPYITHTAKPDAYFPGKNIATYIVKQWKQQYPNQPLKYIAGTHYLVANIVAYNATLSLVPYFDWRVEESAWVNVADLKKSGAVFVLLINSPQLKSYFPKKIWSRFPKTRFINVRCFSKLTHAQIEPVCIRLAILPPA